ncbi:MAG: type II secretion system protein [Deltaproteobacteria bacterium]|nr:type II secretion system protein [Deltaproteobacteria bacterium]
MIDSLKQIKNHRGFTLVEVMVAVVILGLMVSGISALYFSGFQSLNMEDDRMLLDSRLRGRMEQLVGQPFGGLSDSSEVVTVKGQNYTISWTVTLADLDGDATPDPNAKQVTVTVAGMADRTLTTILVDNEGKVGKI